MPDRRTLPAQGCSGSYVAKSKKKRHLKDLGESEKQEITVACSGGLELQKDVAERFGISSQLVSKLMKDAR